MPAKLKKQSEDICFILAINSLSFTDQKKKKKKEDRFPSLYKVGNTRSSEI